MLIVNSWSRRRLVRVVLDGTGGKLFVRGIAHDHCDVPIHKGSAIPPSSLTRSGRGMAGTSVNMLQKWKTCSSFLWTSPFFCFLLECATVCHYDLSRTCRFIFIHFAFTPPDFCARNGRCINATEIISPCLTGVLQWDVKL